MNRQVTDVERHVVVDKEFHNIRELLEMLMFGLINGARREHLPTWLGAADLRVLREVLLPDGREFIAPPCPQAPKS